MLTGSGDASRVIQGHLHMDPYAPLEVSSSTMFKTAVAEERKRWHTAKKPDIARWKRLYEKTLDAGIPKNHSYAQTQTQWQGQTVQIQTSYAHLKNVWFNGKLKYEGLETFVLGETTYATIEDKGEGSEEFTLVLYGENHREIKRIKNVGPQAAFSQDDVYFQTVENKLRYNGVNLLKKEHQNLTKVFEEPDQRYQIDILNPPYQNAIFIRVSHALTQRIGRIVGSKEIEWITPFQLSILVPVTEGTWLSNTAIHRGKKTTSLPPNEYAVDGIEYQNRIYVITVKKGTHTLWVSQIQDAIHTWTKVYFANGLTFLGSMRTPTLLCDYSWKASEVYNILNQSVLLKLPTVINLSHFESTIKDIPYTVVYSGKPNKLLVNAYGAYGIEAARSYPIRWLPWIQAGYAFAVAMPRGGRDDGDRWWDEARTAPRKHRTFEDTATVIEAVQKRMKIPPSKTVFYGRSAGGWTAAMIALQYGYLVKGVIAEVPYVDVLRTTTNEDLPLTKLEYEEFGDPLHKKADYDALLKISPVDITKPQVNAPTVLIKTALNDVQVATYEGVKWAATLRENGWPNVYVSIDTDGGHFVKRTNAAQQYAEDAAFFQDALGRDTRRTANQRSRGITRRITNSSKH